jgi:hypothetical protein
VDWQRATAQCLRAGHSRRRSRPEVVREHTGGSIITAVQAQVGTVVGNREGQGSTCLAQVALPVAHGRRRQYPFPFLVRRYRAVCPEVEAFLQLGAVEQADIGLHEGRVGIQADADHPHHAAAPADFANPDGGFLAVLFGIGKRVPHGLVRGVAVTDGEVELDAAGNPRAGQPNECRFNGRRLVKALAFRDFIVQRPHPPAEFGKHHHAQVGVFQHQRAILARLRLIAQSIQQGIRIYRPVAPALQRRMRVRFTHRIGGMVTVSSQR